MTIDMASLLLIFFISLVVPLIVETVKRLTAMMRKKWCWELIPKILQPVLNSVIWTILLCFTAKAGIFKAFGFVLIWPWLDYLVTGLVASLGAEKLYSLVTNMKEYKEKLAIEKAKG